MTKRQLCGWVLALGLGIVGTAQAQTADTAQPVAPRGFVDVNFGVAMPSAGTFTNTGDYIVAREIATFRTDYEASMGANFEFGGGVMFTRNLGASVFFDGQAHNTTAVGTVQAPSPLFFNDFATATGGETSAMRVESQIHLSVVGLLQPTDKLQIRLYGGPTMAHGTQELVDYLEYQDTTLLPHRAVISDVSSGEYDLEQAWGFHAGADVGFFFNRVIGVGTNVRFVSGQFEGPNAMDSAGRPQMYSFGGTQISGGLRLRFGSQ